jgi:hypothetical protein
VERFLIAAFVLLIPVAVGAQEKTPVAVGHTGKDRVGTFFVDALNRELSHSALYEPMKANEKGFRFYVDLITVDTADIASEKGKKSVISVAIEDFGRPNSYPVPEMWYHKVIIVNRQQVDEIAKKLLEDMDARWCSYSRNSVGGCPKEKLEPYLSPD